MNTNQYFYFNTSFPIPILDVLIIFPCGIASNCTPAYSYFFLLKVFSTGLMWFFSLLSISSSTWDKLKECVMLIIFWFLSSLIHFHYERIDRCFCKTIMFIQVFSITHFLTILVIIENTAWMTFQKSKLPKNSVSNELINGSKWKSSNFSTNNFF